MAPGRRLPRWLAPGDWNAFFGLALDNLTQLVILSGLLIGVFKFPADLVLGRMVPGTAAGVMIGDLVYTALAVRLMRRTGRDDVTAMPFGIDTPSLFGLVFGVLGPAMLLTGDPILAWKIGMGVTVAMGGLKLVLAFGRRLGPRPRAPRGPPRVHRRRGRLAHRVSAVPQGLRGSPGRHHLAHHRARRPRGPGEAARRPARRLRRGGGGAAVYWIRAAAGAGPAPLDAHPVALSLAIPWPTLAWAPVFGETLPYLSLAAPFALATVIGGIDNTESAIAAGDEYRARDILLTEALATMAAGVCGE